MIINYKVITCGEAERIMQEVVDNLGPTETVDFDDIERDVTAITGMTRVAAAEYLYPDDPGYQLAEINRILFPSGKPF